MFTGIVETTGNVVAIELVGTNYTFWIASNFSDELSIDQSVAHSGVCLTVEATSSGMHSVTAIEETLQKTNLGHWEIGTLVNLERCVPLNGRLDGHLVQGHIDTTAICIAVASLEGSWQYSFRFPASFAGLVVEKGSICINGISLTLFNITQDTFTIAVIPYTYNHTNISQLQVGSSVNLEFDMVGKYILRNLQLQQLG